MNSIVCKNLSKSFPIDEESLLVLDDINLIINQGESLAITGKSGSGKSTLLQILAGLDFPSKGSIFFNNREDYS